MGQLGATGRVGPHGSRTRRTAFALAAGALLVALVGPTPAIASLKQDMARFSDCPLSDPTVTECVYSTTSSGEFVIGKSQVPINKTITIQGGLNPPKIVPALDGNTLSRTPLVIPGGLIGIELLGNFTEVTATAELAGPAELGTTVVLPLKLKLDNPLLGGGCYLGSNSEPVALNLTYATTNPPPPNKPISGKALLTTRDNGAIVSIAGTLVDNSFSAPGANGCTLLPFIGDFAVDLKEGLPSAAGHNTAIMTGTTEEANAQVARAVAPLPDFGRCEKAQGISEGGKTVYHGGYLDSTCTTGSGEMAGKFEWASGPGPNRRFSGTSGKLTLETPAGAQVLCSAGSNAGEYTGPKTERLSLKLTGCAIGPKGKGASCQTSSASPGEIDSAPLLGTLDFIKENESPEVPVVGLDLRPQSGANVAVFECGGATVSVSGSVILPISAVEKMTSTLKLAGLAVAGHQQPEAFEVGPSDTLTSTRSGGGSEQAGLTLKSSSVGEEPIEVKAEI